MKIKKNTFVIMVFLFASVITLASCGGGGNVDSIFDEERWNELELGSWLDDVFTNEWANISFTLPGKCVVNQELVTNSSSTLTKYDFGLLFYNETKSSIISNIMLEYRHISDLDKWGGSKDFPKSYFSMLEAMDRQVKEYAKERNLEYESPVLEITNNKSKRVIAGEEYHTGIIEINETATNEIYVRLHGDFIMIFNVNYQNIIAEEQAYEFLDSIEAIR